MRRFSDQLALGRRRDYRTQASLGPGLVAPRGHRPPGLQGLQAWLGEKGSFTARGPRRPEEKPRGTAMLALSRARLGHICQLALSVAASHEPSPSPATSQAWLQFESSTATALASVLALRRMTCSESQHGCSRKVEGYSGDVGGPCGSHVEISLLSLTAQRRSPQLRVSLRSGRGALWTAAQAAQESPRPRQSRAAPHRLCGIREVQKRNAPPKKSRTLCSGGRGPLPLRAPLPARLSNSFLLVPSSTRFFSDADANRADGHILTRSIVQI